MFKLLTKGFWEAVARLILRNRIAILVSIALVTLFFAYQWKNMRFTYTEANLLPDDNPINITYNEFLKIFGEEGNLIVLGVKDPTLLTVEKLNAWNQLAQDFKAYPEVDAVLSIKELQKLVKNTDKETFELEPFIKDSVQSQEQINLLARELFEQYPFYDNFLFNSTTKTIRTAIYLKK
ncbi:MAG TPA: RND family transporter, partial [Aquaticitalea sp.]|nr:RND family transporter [Aquaticitalea sp.]